MREQESGNQKERREPGRARGASEIERRKERERPRDGHKNGRERNLEREEALSPRISFAYSESHSKIAPHFLLGVGFETRRLIPSAPTRDWK